MRKDRLKHSNVKYGEIKYETAQKLQVRFHEIKTNHLPITWRYDD